MKNVAYRNVVLTGVTGLIGRHVLYELLREAFEGQFNNRIYVTIRSSTASPVTRLENLLEPGAIPEFLTQYSLHAMLNKIVIVPVDLLADDLAQTLHNLVPANCHVIHSAACTNLATTDAAEVDVLENNLKATQNLLAACKNHAKKIIYISSSFAIGRTEGVIDDDYLSRSSGESRNHYEKIKLEAEKHLVEFCDEHKIAWQILRPSIVCGRLLDSPYYYMSKFDVFYGFAKCFAYLASNSRMKNPIRIVCKEESSLNIVPVDYVAKVIVRCFATPVKQLNIVHNLSVPARELVESILSAVGFSQYEIVNTMPEDLNKEERFYYATAGGIFTGYITSPEHSFNTRRIQILMNGFNPPDILPHMKNLLQYALQCGFDANATSAVAQAQLQQHRPRRIVIVGGGYTGFYAYKKIASALYSEIRNKTVEIIVISASAHHAFHGFVGEVVAGILPIENIFTSIRSLFKNAHVMSGIVTSVNAATQSLSYRDHANQMHTLNYDELVLSLGSMNNSNSVAGLDQYGYSVRSLKTLDCFKQQIGCMLELAQSNNGESELTQQALTFVVAGGGFTGIEMCTALAHYFKTCEPHYPILKKMPVKIILVQSGSEILPDLQGKYEQLIHYARKQLNNYGIELKLNCRITEIKQNNATLSDGAIIATRTVLSTVGHLPVSMPGLESHEVDTKGRLIADNCLHLQGQDNIWIGGDCASVIQPHKNYACPTNALWAIKQGQHIGYNIACKVKYKLIKPFSYRGLGQAASLGNFRGIAELYGVQMTGVLAKLNRLGFFLYYMPSKRNAIKVLFELCLNSVAGNKLPLNNDIEKYLLPNEKHTLGENQILSECWNVSTVHSIDTLNDAIKKEPAHV